MLLENVDKIHEFFSPDFIAELSKNEIRTVSDFQRVDPENIVEISQECKCEPKENLTTVFKFRKYLFTTYAAYSAESWYSINPFKSNVLKTRVKVLDDVINGGFKGGVIYEAYGMPGSGRTQLCLHLAAINALDGGNTLYIDTKNDFCVDRFCEILTNNLKKQKESKRIKLDCDINDELIQSYLNRVKLSKIYNIHSLLSSISNIIQNLNDLTSENCLSAENWKFYRNVKLLVIDNIASIVLPLLGDEKYPMGDITALTSDVIDKIRELAVQHNIIVFVINNIVVNSSTYTRNFKDSTLSKSAIEPSYKPSLGKLFCDAANTRFRIIHKKLIEKDNKVLYQRGSIREILLERDDSTSNIDTLSKCSIQITCKGLESMI